MKTKFIVCKILALTLVFGLLAATGAVAEDNAVITGMVDVNASDMIIISADDGEDYLVIGRDLSEMIGKTIKVTGTLEEKDDGKSISIMEIEEIKE